MYNVVMFGTGDFSNSILNDVNNKYNLIGYIDNSKEKQNTFYKSKKIYSPTQIFTLNYDKIILASIEYADEMFNQLLTLGVSKHNVIFDYVLKKEYRIYTKDLFKMQLTKDGDFNRIDIIIRYMAIDSYINGNSYGIDLYKKMQKKRLGISDCEIEYRWTKFINLTESIRLNGFDNQSFIECDKFMNIIDGSHRVASSLYFGNEIIPVKYSFMKFNCNYSLSWFENNCFTSEEISSIKEYFVKINNDIENEIIGFIWPPAMNYYEEILSELKLVSDIKKVELLNFKEDEFSDFVKRIYVVDDIENWKIEKKIESMNDCSKKEIAVIYFDLNTLDYRLKKSTNKPISTKVELIKKHIREKYKDKIPNYYYDNIIHIADNLYQTEIIKKILSISLNISECFEMIENYNYALTKIDVPYMVHNFPYCFPIKKDVDILVSKEDMQIIQEKILLFVNNYCDKNSLQIKIIKLVDRVKIRIEYLEFLIYQFDINCNFNNIYKGFLNKALSQREYKDGIYILNIEDELEIRKYEINNNPKKIYHKEYIDKYYNK